MRDRRIFGMTLLLVLIGVAAPGQAPPVDASRVLEQATELDHQAQEARSPGDRRARWDRAADLLERFLHDHPNDESAPLVRFQAAVYRWAEGRSFADQVDLHPVDAAARSSAITQFDRAIAAFRAVGVEPRPGMGADSLVVNVRFRLAQALADRARLEPESNPARASSEREAAGLLEPVLSNPQLRGFARLLRGELNNRLGQFTQGQIDVEEAEKATPPLDPETLTRAKVAALIGRAQFGDARKVAAEAKIDEAARTWLALRVALSQRRGVPPGRDRAGFDAEAFTLALKLRDSDRPEATRALLELASAIDEPGEDRPLEWWDLLADGQIRLGNPTRAGHLLAKGAARATRPDQAVAATAAWMKAGACLFEAERYAESAALLARVVDDPAAPADLRARAGMLIALGKGRAVATKQTGATRVDFLRALEEQVRRFPTEVATGEARWLLGRVRRESGQRDEAIALWQGVNRAHARWLDARLAAADSLRVAVDEAAIGGETKLVAARVDEARRQLDQSRAEATAGPEFVELAFRVAALELIPGVGRGESALAACDGILRGEATPTQHQRARLVRVAALARAGQLVEADRAARAEVRQVDPASLMEPVRLLDRFAGEAAADSNRRRLGLVDQVFTNRLNQAIETLPASVRDEVRLRGIRAAVFAGDLDAARRDLSAWGGPGGDVPEPILRDLADTYARLNSFGLAADAERLRARKLPAGSAGWFDAQYNQALAQFRDGKVKEARRIIDGVAILHPTLGGAGLRDRFERLRQRLAQE